MTALNYYELISAKAKEAIRRKKAEGEWMHQAPLGYRNVRVDGRVVLERDSRKYRLVQEAKLLRKQGHSIKAICRIMKAKGLRSKRHKVVGPSSMHLILSRR